MRHGQTILAVGFAALAASTATASGATKPSTQAGATETAVLQPAGPWNLVAEPTYCALARPFGDPSNPYQLRIQFNPLTALSWTRIHHHEALKARDSGDATIEVDGRPLDHSVHFNIFKDGDGRVTREFMLNRFRQELPPTSSTVRLVTPKHGVVSLALDDYAKAMQAADACMTDLYRDLGIDAAQASRVAIPPQGFALQDIDLPMKNNQFDVTLLFWVNEQGRVDECKILAPAEQDRFRATLCEKVKDKARFKPATDATGAAIRAAVFDDIRLRRAYFPAK